MSIDKKAERQKLAESFFPRIRKLVVDYQTKYPSLNTKGYEPTKQQVEDKIDKMYKTYNPLLKNVFITKIAESLEKDAEDQKFIDDLLK
jgi:hypothetical protein